MGKEVHFCTEEMKGRFYSLSGVPVVVMDAEGEMATVKRKWGGVLRVRISDLTPIAITPYYLVRSLHFDLVCGDQIILERRKDGHHYVMVRTDLLSWCLIIDGGTHVAEVRYVNEIQDVFQNVF